jgi:hypothetical protein
MNNELDLERLLRTHLVERADSRPGEGALEAVLAITAGIRPRRSWRATVEKLIASAAARVGLSIDAARTSRVVWLVVLLALLLALALGAALVGGHGPRSVVSVAPSPSTPVSAEPSNGPLPSGSAVAGPCAIPGVFTPGQDVSVPLGGADATGPAGGRVAVVGQAPNQAAQIWLAGAGLNGSRLLATSNITRAQPPEVVGSSADASTLLVSTLNVAGAGPATHFCGDLFLVRTDGSAVTKLTDNPPGDAAEGGALGPDGRSVAYVDGAATQDLHLIDATGVDRVLDPSPCGGGLFSATPVDSGELAWSPDGTRLAVSCDAGFAGTTGLKIYPTVGGAPRAVLLPAGTTEAALGWAADGRHILVADVPSSEPQNHLSVLSISPDSGVATVVSRTSLSVEWVVPFPASPFSPDRKWVLATGGAPGSQPGTNFNEVLYLVNVATGAARQVIGQPDSLGSFQWLADSSGFVFSDNSTPSLNLLELNVTSGKAKTIGLIPNAVSSYWIGP